MDLVSDLVDLHLRRKWFRISHKGRRSWILAAKALMSLGQRGKIVFGGKQHYKNLIQEYWPNNTNTNQKVTEFNDWTSYM